MTTTQTGYNIARFLPVQARERPDQPAVVAGAGRDPAGRVIYQGLSFAELDRASDAYAWGLSGYIGAGARVLLMVPAGLPLVTLTFALFKAGCMPILIDPAMGRRNLADCIAECQPDALVGIEKAQIARLLFRHAFRSVRRTVTVGRRLGWGGATLEELKIELRSPFPIASVGPDDQAAILFTTGSTGAPKGVLYTHGMFDAQREMLQSFYGVQPGEVDMPAFPLFALFNVAMGVTSAIPDLDPTRPASCDPAKIVEIIQDQRVTLSFGSPAIWQRVTRFCLDRGVTLPTLRRVLMAGAPVPLELHRRFARILSPEADTHTPYGATEALPVASISGREVLRATEERGDVTAGTCVGRPVPGVTLRIIPVSDAPIPEWDDRLALPPFQVGEIVVKGPAVTRAYVGRPQANLLAKIREGEQIWHRVGDLGYQDDVGRLWFYGRKSHRVKTAQGTLYTEPCELVFNQHPAVFRSALVGVPARQAAAPTAQPETGLRATNGHGPTLGQAVAPVEEGPWSEPVIVIEPDPGKLPRDAAGRERFVAELLALGAAQAMTRPIQTVLFHPAFPVDIRHNAKIFREKLSVWAEDVLSGRRQEGQAR